MGCREIDDWTSRTEGDEEQRTRVVEERSVAGTRKCEKDVGRPAGKLPVVRSDVI